jgi:hypothetical protein
MERIENKNCSLHPTLLQPGKKKPLGPYFFFVLKIVWWKTTNGLTEALITLT